MPIEQVPKADALHSMMQVRAWKLYVIGFVLSLFNIWLGLLYALVFLFSKESRRMSLILLAWWLLNIVAAFVFTAWLSLHGYGYLLPRQNTPALHQGAQLRSPTSTTQVSTTQTTTGLDHGTTTLLR